jgi:hypothetical protein
MPNFGNKLLMSLINWMFFGEYEQHMADNRVQLLNEYCTTINDETAIKTLFYLLKYITVRFSRILKRL